MYTSFPSKQTFLGVLAFLRTIIKSEFTSELKLQEKLGIHYDYCFRLPQHCQRMIWPMSAMSTASTMSTMSTISTISTISTCPQCQQCQQMSTVSTLLTVSKNVNKYQQTRSGVGSPSGPLGLLDLILHPPFRFRDIATQIFCHVQRTEKEEEEELSIQVREVFQN